MPSLISFSNITLFGRLTADPEVGQTNKASSYANVSVAVAEKYTNDAGEKIDATSFVDVTCYGASAEIVKDRCRKGSRILLNGEFATDRWVDKETEQPRRKLYVKATRIVIVDWEQGAEQA